MTDAAGSVYALDGIRYAPKSGRRTGFVLEIEALGVDEGNILALVGPNGAGKTTLLMLLAFLARPEAGRIGFRGRFPWEEGEGAADIARRETVLATHHPYLFKGTVGDNLAFGLKVRGVPAAEWPARVREALALVEMPGWGERPVAGLSAGQAQRVALARAFVLRPKVLLLDEPTANVESGLGMRIEAVIGEFVRQAGTTVVFSTHNFAQASRLAGEILYLSEGRRATFSHENCFSGTAATDGRSSWIEPRPGMRIVFPGRTTGHVACVIDPGRIRLEVRRGDGGSRPPEPNAFPGEIIRLEMIEGGRVLVRIAGELTFRAVLPRAEAAKEGISLSLPVLVRFDPEAVELVGPPSSDASA